METITIRQLNELDVDELKKVYLETVQSEFPEYTQSVLDYFSAEYADEMMKTPIKLGAFYDGKLAGYLIANNQFGGILYVVWLAVLNEHQRKGIGKKLLDTIEKIALEQGAHSIHLEAIEKVLPFYKSAGYEQFGFDKEGYFGTDNYLLKKILRKPDEKEYLKEFLEKK